MLGHTALAAGLEGLPHFAPTAKRIIYLFQSGGPSQLEMFDPKPLLTKMYKQDLPESVRKGQRLTTMSASQSSFPIVPSKYKFAQHGKSGAWVSELLPHTAKIADDPAHTHADFIYTLSGWTQPSRAFRLAGGRSSTLAQFDTKAPPGLPAVVVQDVMVRSHDGVTGKHTRLARVSCAAPHEAQLVLRFFTFYPSQQKVLAPGVRAQKELMDWLSTLFVYDGGEFDPMFDEASRMPFTRVKVPASSDCRMSARPSSSLTTQGCQPLAASPKLMQPRQMRETLSPVLPSLLYCMFESCPDFSMRSARGRRLRRFQSGHGSS